MNGSALTSTASSGTPSTTKRTDPSQTPITYYENDNANFGLALYRQAPRSVRAGLKVTY